MKPGETTNRSAKFVIHGFRIRAILTSLFFRIVQLVREFGKILEERMLHKYKAGLIFRSKRYVGDLWYKFICWAWYRYSTVRPEGLPHTWIDRDRLMVHCMFQLLCDFIEKEQKPDPDAWLAMKESTTEDYRRERFEIDKEQLALYKWWKHDYPKLQDSLEADEEINNYCMRLIKIRGYLWT